MRAYVDHLSAELPGQYLVCSTPSWWTSGALTVRWNSASAIAAQQVSASPEYQHVRRAGGSLTWPVDTSDQHDVHLAAIDAMLQKLFAGPTVLVMHRAPRAQSLHPGDKRHECASALASNLERMIWSRRPSMGVRAHPPGCRLHDRRHVETSTIARIMLGRMVGEIGWNETLTVDV